MQKIREFPIFPRNALISVIFVSESEIRIDVVGSFKLIPV